MRSAFMYCKQRQLVLTPLGELGSSDLAEAAFTELAADHDVLITTS